MHKKDLKSSSYKNLRESFAEVDKSVTAYEKQKHHAPTITRGRSFEKIQETDSSETVSIELGDISQSRTNVRTTIHPLILRKMSPNNCIIKL